MKLDILIPDLNLSGTSRTAQALANHLAARGHDVSVVAVGGKGEGVVLAENIPCTFLGCVKNGPLGKAGYGAFGFLRLARYLRCNRPSFLMCWGKEFAVIATVLVRLFGIKTKIVGVNTNAIAPHLAESSRALAWLKRRIYMACMPQAFAWIAQSKGMLDEMASFGIEKCRIGVVYPALFESFFSESLPHTQKSSLVFVGRLVEQKAPLRLLELTGSFLTENEDWTLHIVGDGPLRPIMEAWARRNKLDDRIIFHGQQREVIPYMQSARALLLTSRYEGFGMVLAEACALGVPVISLDCPVGPAEIVVHGKNGYLAGDDAAFRAYLSTMKTATFDPVHVRASVEKFHPGQVLAAYEDFFIRQVVKERG